MCEKYPEDILSALSSPAPDEEITEKQPLKVGIADLALDFPIGVSMAGFGNRGGTSNPYRQSLGGSDSMFDRPRAKAFVFDNGLKRIIILKTPMGWSTDYLATQVAWNIYQARGENYLNRIIFSAPHSHSLPGRYWSLLPGSSTGILGHGEFSPEMFHRIANTLTQTVMAALDDLQPARFGYAILDPMDIENHVHEDRRHEDTYPIDDSLVVFRIDDMQGNPRAVLVNMALHGTIFSEEPTITQDAPGGVEIIAQENLQKETGLPIKVAFISGNSGDVTPSTTGSDTSDGWRWVQEVGHRTWPMIKELFDELEGKTSSDIDLDIANRRVPVSREKLSYGDEEFYNQIRSLPCEEDKECSTGNECIQGFCSDVYHFGALMCVQDSDEDPQTQHQDGRLGCLMSVGTISMGIPIPQFHKNRLTIASLGGLGIATISGEPTGHYGRTIADYMEQSGFDDATIFAYSQDHHFYLLSSDNWLQGGYAPSLGIWGWREGDYYAEKTIEMIDQFTTSSGGFVDNAGIKPTWFDNGCTSDQDCPLDPKRNQMICSAAGYCIVAPTISDNPGAIIKDVPAVVQRTERVGLIFSGGHPGVDLPKMTLQRLNTSEFIDHTNAAGQPYQDDGFNTMLWYRGDYKTDHTWEVGWEEAIDYPTGQYRIKIEGHYYDGSQTQEYELYSSAFELMANQELLILNLQLQQDSISGFSAYPPPPTNDDGQTPFGTLKPLGVLRHTVDNAPTMPWPLAIDESTTITVSIQPTSSGEIVIEDMTLASIENTTYEYISSRDAEGLETKATLDIKATSFAQNIDPPIEPGSYTITIEILDAWENRGQLVQEIVLE
jgi:hypothetical protein